MNNEIIKAMNRKPKKKIFRKWWSKNGYKVNRVIFFPIWIGALIVKKIQTKLNNRQVWSEERAKQIAGGFATAKKNITIQFQGRERLEENLLNLIRKDALDHGIKDEEIELVDVYIKPEEQLVYYVINKEISGSIAF